MKAIEAWSGREVVLGRNTYTILSAHTQAGDTWAEVTGANGRQDRIGLIRATPALGTEGTVPTGDAFIDHVARLYGPGPYKGSTAATIREFVRDNPLCGCQWVQSRQSLAVALDARAEVC